MRDMLRVDVSLEHELARRIENARHPDLALR
jgi:hypothetical protein